MCTRLEEPEKLAQAELCVETALWSAESLNPAQVPSPFRASEEVIVSLANSPYLLLRLLLFVLTQNPSSPCSLSWRWQTLLWLLSSPRQPSLTGGFFVANSTLFHLRHRLFVSKLHSWKSLLGAVLAVSVKVFLSRAAVFTAHEPKLTSLRSRGQNTS